MATYLQWSRSRPVRPVTWVCGAQPVLVHDVTEAHRATAAGLPVTLYAADGEREVWDVLFSEPPVPGRVTVVHGAEKLKSGDYAEMLARGQGPAGCTAVFVLDGDDFPREEGKLPAYLLAARASRSGQLVRCCEPSRASDRAALVASWWPGLNTALARDVLDRCGSLEAAWQACAQARAAGLAPTLAMTSVVCRGEPAGELAELLTAGKRSQAMAVAQKIPHGELGGVIGLLAVRLTVIEQLTEMTRAGLQARDAVSRMRADRFTAVRVAPYLGAYRPDRVRRCRRLLANLEAAWRDGVRAGVAESLAALW